MTGERRRAHQRASGRPERTRVQQEQESELWA